MITTQTCRSCGEVMTFDECMDDAIRTGYRHWMHKACITPAYVARLHRRLLQLRSRIVATEFDHVSRRLVAKAEKLEAIIREASAACHEVKSVNEVYSTDKRPR